jgi:hypothetical protein
VGLTSMRFGDRVFWLVGSSVIGFDYVRLVVLTYTMSRVFHLMSPHFGKTYIWNRKSLRVYKKLHVQK